MARETLTLEVFAQRGHPDHAGEALCDELRHAGFRQARGGVIAQLYRLNGTLGPADLQRIATDLLCDPVIQDWRTDDGRGAAAPTASKDGAALVIDVWYKPGVTDVVGESVLKGIRDLGISRVSEVRTGSRFRLWGLNGRDVADRISAAFLSNPLIQDHEVHADQ